MIGFVVRRLLHMIPVVLLASLGIFAMIYAVPGGPVGALLGDNATPEQVHALTVQLGLDRPVLVQYLAWLRNALAGDLGTSIQSHDAVLALIAARLPASLQLAVTAMIIGLLLGVPAAIASAVAPSSWIDRALSGWGALALGVPTFWVGILLILLFAVVLHWLPRRVHLCAVLAIAARHARERRAAGAHTRHLCLRHLRALPARLADRRAGGRLRAHRARKKVCAAARSCARTCCPTRCFPSSPSSV